MYLCSELIPILYEEASGATRRLTANLEELSASSLMFLSETEIEPGSQVAMSIKNCDLYGLVESCAQDEVLGWFIRVRLHHHSRWSGQRFVPDHFLALRIPEPAEVNSPSEVFA